jgi:drug/metabolite transporter (DMT)-like permease
MNEVTPAFTGTLGLIFFFVWLLLAVITLFNMFRTHSLNLDNKLLWIVVIVVVPIIGSLIYFFWISAKKPEA